MLPLDEIDPMMCIPVVAKDSIVQSKTTKGEMVIRTRYNGPHDIFLNKTASLIFDKALDGKKSVSEIVDLIVDKYALTDKTRITEDVLTALHEMWNLAAITWVNGNPFLSSYSKKLKNGDLTVKATYEFAEDVSHKIKEGIYFSPHLRADGLSPEQISFGVVHKTLDIYMYFENRETLRTFIIANKNVNSMNIISIYSNNSDGGVKDLGYLFEELLSIAGMKMATIYIPEADKTPIQNNIANLGFECAGILRKDVVSGDVRLYVKS